MKKIVVGLGGLILVILLLPIIALGVFQTQHGTAMFNRIAEQAHWPVRAQNVRYDFPYQFTLFDVQLFEQDPLYVQEITLWLNPSLYRDEKWQIDSLLLDGINLADGLPKALLRVPRSDVHLHQLALKNVDVAYHDHAARGLDLQIQNPIWLNADQWLPYGELQLAAEQWYWQGEALDNILLDMTYRPQDSTIFGASFDWRGAKISGQAEQYPTGWSLVNVTIDGLKLDQSTLQALNSKPWHSALSYVNHINSLDLLRSDLRWETLHWVNLNLSLENLTLPFHPFAQRQAKLSFSADSVQDEQQMWVEPRANLTLNGRRIDVHDVTTNWQQGTLSARGAILPDALHLHQLSINRIKWVIEDEADVAWMDDLLNHYPNWRIDQLDVKHSQVIQLVSKPFWQVTGLNVDGQQMVLKQAGQWGLWQGILEASAANASYNEMLASQPIITLHSDKGNWHLTRLNAPLEQGFIKATGAINLTPFSRPWWIEFEAEGLPSDKLLTLPPLLQLQGMSSWNGRVSGLGGDWTMFNHSLSGEVSGALHDTQARLAQEPWAAVTVSPITLEIDRGRISLPNVTMQGDTLSGNVTGQLDLAQRSLNTLRYQIQQGCAQWRGHWLDDRSQSYNACQIEAHAPVIKTRSSTKTVQQPVVQDSAAELLPQ